MNQQVVDPSPLAPKPKTTWLKGRVGSNPTPGTSRPASDVAAPTPRLWKERFAAEPLRSAIDLPAYDAVR